MPSMQLPYSKDHRLDANIEQRIFKLKQISTFLQGLTILDDSPKNNDELLKLYNDNYSDYKNYDTFDAVKKQQIDAKHDKFEDLLMIAGAEEENPISDSDKIKTMSKFIADNAIKLFTKTEDFSQLKDALDMVLQDKTLNNKLKNLGREQIATIITDGSLIDSDKKVGIIDMLKDCIKRINARLKSDEAELSAINSNKPLTNQNQLNNEPLLYDTCPELRPIFVCLRDDFARQDGSKENFLQLMGNLFEAGRGSLSTKICYKTFCDIIAKNYPDNPQEAVDLALNTDSNVKTENLEKTRFSNFENKSKELYYKFLTAVIIEKLRQEPTFRDFKNYLANIKLYIDGLRKGENNPGPKLHLSDESNISSTRELQDATGENLVISVHHNEPPVAAVLDLYIRSNPQLHSQKQISEFANAYKTATPNFDKEVQNYINRHPEWKLTKKQAEDKLILQKIKIGFGMALFPEEDKMYNRVKWGKVDRTAVKVEKNKIFRIYQEYFNHEYKTLQICRSEVLSMLNNIGNHVLPITQEAHIKLESNGNLNVGAQKDNIIFAANYTQQEFNIAVKIIAGINSDTAANMQKYAKPNPSNNGRPSVISALKLPDNSVMSRCRPVANKTNENIISAYTLINSALNR